MEWLNKIPEKNKNLGSRIIDGEAVVIPLLQEPLVQNETFVIFNETATRIWQLCDGDKTGQEIAGKLTEEYLIENKEAEIQVSNLIDEMVQRGLIIVKEEEQ